MTPLTKHRVRRDRPHPPRSIRPVRLDRQPSLLTRTHVQQALIPPLDHLALADVEGERLATVVARVELGAVAGECASVVHFDLVAGFRFAVALGGRGYLDVEGFIEGGGEREEGEKQGCETHADRLSVDVRVGGGWRRYLI